MKTASKTACATARTTGVAWFFRKKSKFESYPQPKEQKASAKPAKYSVSKYHYDALIRKYYREARKTDKTSSREELLLQVTAHVMDHLSRFRLSRGTIDMREQYSQEIISKPVVDAPQTESYKMNFLQRAMYRRLMYGLSEFTPQQIADLSHKFEQQIQREHRITKKAIQIMKAKRLYGVETKLINAMFQHAPIGDSDYEWIMDIPKKYTLRNLGISAREIVDELIKRRLLPLNFHHLDASQVEL